MNVASVSYGNDSVAMLQWCFENKVPTIAVFIDTGWGATFWNDRVMDLSAWAQRRGIVTFIVTPQVQFEELMIMKKGFPNQRYQWCSGLLKTIPFLNWIDDADPDCKCTVMIGKRRVESADRSNTPEFIEASEYHGGRRVWHPLYAHSDEDRDALLHRAGVEVLPFRSQECAPCVNANSADFRALGQTEIDRTARLEAAVGKTMFRPKRHKGAIGIVQVVQWAQTARRRKEQPSGCDTGMCGL